MRPVYLFLFCLLLGLILEPKFAHTADPMDCISREIKKEEIRINEEKEGDAALDLITQVLAEKLETSQKAGFKSSQERQEAWGKNKLPRLSAEQEKLLIDEFVKDGRDILIVTDVNKKMTAGTVVVFKTLKNYIETMTDHKVKVRVVSADDFLGFHIPFKIFQDAKVSFPTTIQIKNHLKNVQAVHIAMEGPVGGAFKSICKQQGIKFTTAYHTMRPEYVGAAVEEIFKKSGMNISQFIQWFTTRSVGSSHAAEYMFSGLAEKVGTTAKILMNAIYRRFHKDSQSILSPTKSLLDHLEKTGYDPEQLFAWSHGFELDVFKPSGRPHSEVQDQIYPGLKRPIIGYAGRISVEKNLVPLLSADFDGTLVLMGDGPKRAELEARFPKAKFLGKIPREKMPLYMEGLDAFMFPSLTDTAGLVMPEAMGVGTPVIGFNVQGPKDFVVSPKLGELIPYNELDSTANSKAISGAISRAVKLNRADVRKEAENFDWKFSVLEFLHRLERLPPTDSF